MAQVTGRVFVTVGGNRLASKEGAKLTYGGVERDTVIADTGVVGYQEKTVAPKVECTIPHTSEVSLAQLQDIKDQTLSFDTDSGKSFILSSAWLAKGLEMEKGEMKLEFGALTCKEV